MSFDIALRDNGAGSFDIALASIPSAISGAGSATLGVLVGIAAAALALQGTASNPLAPATAAGSAALALQAISTPALLPATLAADASLSVVVLNVLNPKAWSGTLRSGRYYADTNHYSASSATGAASLTLGALAGVGTGALALQASGNKTLASLIASASGGAEAVGRAIRVSAGHLVDAEGERVFLQGCNLSGLENSVIHKAQPWADDGGTPQWATYATWKPNVVRIPLNAACFLNLTVAQPTSATTWGTPWSADLYGNYRQAMADAIVAARAIGCYIIFDLHWCAAQATLGGTTHYLAPLGQSAFADRDTGLPFWIALVAWLQATFPAGFADVIFDLYNEPFLDSFSAGLADVDAALKVGGVNTRLINRGTGPFEITQAWTLLGYQEALDAIRSAGASNVVMVAGNSYAQSLQPWAKFLPTDALGQVAFAWHPYPHDNAPYGKTGSDAGAGTSAFAQWALAIEAAGHPVIIGEDGGDNSTQGPHVTYMADLAAASLDGYVTWQWNGTQAYGTPLSSFYLTIYASNGTTILPVPGPGQANYDFMIANAS